ncbi:MAG: phage tail protein [Rhizobiaceae bacterium]
MKKLIFWTAWFLLAATAAAHAGPVVGLIGVIATGIGSIGQALLGIALSIGSSLLQKALAPKQKQQVAGVKQQITIGGDNPLSFILGPYATPGQLEYVNSWGKAHEVKNAYLTRVISLADLPVGALTGIWAGDTKGTLPDMTGTPPTDWGWPVGGFQSKSGSDYLWIKFYDGKQTAADPWLLSQFGGDPDRPFTSDMIGRGVPYVIVTTRFNQNMWSGIPPMLFETNGAKLYDIRKDSTAGGSGSHRWADHSTWEVSDNPIVHVYNICRGIRFGDEWMWGGQTTQAFQIPAANWMAAMNASDLAIDLAGGGTEKQFRAGREITVDEQPLDVIEEYMAGCSGRFAEIGGIYKVLVGAPGAAVYSFTDDQIIITKEQSLDPFPGLEQTFNGAQASYPEPAEKWGMKDAPAYYRSDLEVLDDNRRLVTGLKFPTVPYAVQVQRLLKAAVEDARRFRQHQFYLPPDAWLLEPNDVLSWSSNRNGYGEKKFLITSITGGSNFLQLVNLKEIDPADNDWTAATDEQGFTLVPIGPIVPEPQVMEGWNAAPITIVDNDGANRRPGIQVSYAGDQDDVQSVRVQVRLAGATALQFDGTSPYGTPTDEPSTNAASISFASILPATDYEVRGILVPFSARDVLWSNESLVSGEIVEGAWLGVTTDDIRLGPKDFYPFDTGAFGDEVNDLIQNFASDARATWEALLEQANVVANHLSERYQVDQSIRTELSVAYGNLTAAYTQAITVAVGPDSAIVAQITALQATVDNDIAEAVDTLTAQIDTLNGEVTANTDAITSLSATVGDVSADGTFRIQAVASPGGGWSRIAAQARATTTDGWATASWFLDAKSDGTSRFVVVADQFIVTDGTNTADPLAFVGGVLTLRAERVEDLGAGLIHGLTGHMQIQLDNDRILVADDS